MDPDAEVERAAALLELGRPYEAADIARGLLADDPDGMVPLMLLLAAETLQGDADSAIETAHRLITAHPTLAEGHLDLAGLLAQTEDFQRAAWVAEGAVMLDPEDPDSVNLLAMTLAADPSRVAEANRAAEQARRLAPDRFEVWLGSCVAFIADQRWAEAVDAAGQAAALEPGSADVHLLLGIAYLGGRQYELGVRHLRTALRERPEPGLLEVARVTLVQLGVPPQVRPLYEQLCTGLGVPDVTAPEFTTTNPDDAELRTAYARALLVDRQLDTARGVLHAVLRDLPGHQDARLVLAQVAALTDDLDFSIELTEALVAERMRDEALYHTRVNAYQRLGRLDEALAALEEAGAAYPESAQFPRRKAEILELLGNKVDALRAVRRAIQLDPADPAARALSDRLGSTSWRAMRDLIRGSGSSAR